MIHEPATKSPHSVLTFVIIACSALQITIVLVRSVDIRDVSDQADNFPDIWQGNEYKACATHDTPRYSLSWLKLKAIIL